MQKIRKKYSDLSNCSNELNIATHACVNKMHLCGKFRFSGLNHSVKKNPNRKNLRKAYYQVLEMFSSSSSIELLLIKIHIIWWTIYFLNCDQI